MGAAVFTMVLKVAVDTGVRGAPIASVLLVLGLAWFAPGMASVELGDCRQYARHLEQPRAGAWSVRGVHLSTPKAVSCPRAGAPVPKLPRVAGVCAAVEYRPGPQIQSWAERVR